MVTSATPLLVLLATIALTAIVTTSARLLDVGTHCPDVCHCTRGPPIRVSCSNEKLTEVPAGLPANTQYLNLSDNGITALHNHSLAHLPQLRYLNLAGNGLVTIAPDAFLKQTHLDTLDLHDNGLKDGEVFEALENLDTLIRVDLHGNLLSTILSRDLLTNSTNDTFSLSTLEHVNLSHNNVSTLPEGLLALLPNLKHLDLSHNRLQTLNLTWSTSDMGNTTRSPLQHGLQTLDVSNNELRAFSVQDVPMLTSLDLTYNMLTVLALASFVSLPALTNLSLAHNPNLTALPAETFAPCPSLEWLDVCYMDGLQYVDEAALTGLTRLKHLNMSHNPQLSYVHATTFSELTAASVIDLSHNALTSINDATFQNLTALRAVRLAGNPWLCNCDSHWLGPQLTNISDRASPLSPEDFVCSAPPELSGLLLVDLLPSHNFSCEGAHVVNYTKRAFHAVGSSAVLDCVAAGDPTPHITWITPRKEVIRYHPAFVHPGRLGPHLDSYHLGHNWHDSPEYAPSLPESARRMHVLPNGSLYLDYVQRHDGGPYTCLVQNHLGNDSVVIHFRLNYLVITNTMVHSMIIGFLAAAIVLALGLISGLIRYLAFTCSREQRQKRKSIREILEGLETYRTDKMDQLSAYKTAKIDQLAAFKTAKVDKLRGYKNITVTTLVHYLHRSREHYTTQTVRIKENCAQQVEKVRENYSMQKDKFKDYRSHQVEKIKENYNGQLLKIRQYGSGQLERLRDQYKLQQQHILKLLELLDIGNCMTVLEAECLRTDSMIFNADLSFDLEAAVYMPQQISSPSGSEYMTAGDTTDNATDHSRSGSVVFDERLDNADSPPTPPVALSSTTQGESTSSSTLTQLKVDEAPTTISHPVRDSAKAKDTPKESSTSKSSSSSTRKGKTNAGDDTTTTKATTATSGSSQPSTSKSRHSRRKQRHKHARQRLDTAEEEEEVDSEKRSKQRRVSSKERRDKQREQKDRQRKVSDQHAARKAIEAKARLDILSHAAEIDKTLEEIAIDIDNLKRDPISLSFPDLNLDLSHGVYTEPEDEQTPLQPVATVTIEHEAGYRSQPPSHLRSSPTTASPSATTEGREKVSPHHQGTELRERWQQGPDHPSTDAPSTDYESAQEPESRGTTPQAGYYEHTGSPQSFASFPSTPSTPTLRDPNPVVILDPETAGQATAVGRSRESTV